jgi:pyruvate dehydrogenase E1 component beta subunit
MLHYALQAARQLAEKEQLDAEVIDVRSLAPIDWATIGSSVRKTRRVVIVEEGPVTGGFGAELAAGIIERWPGTRIVRVASPDVPVPFTPVLEKAYRPDVKRVISAVKEVV